MNNSVQSPLSTKLQYLSLGLLAMMLTLPFFASRHIPPNPSFWNEAIAIGLGLLASFVLISKQHWKPLKFPAIALVPLGLILVVLIQVPMGLMALPHHHLMVATYLLWAAVLMLLGASLRHSMGLHEVVPVLAIALLLGGLTNAVMVGMQMGGITLDGYVMRPVKGYHANTGQVNHLADYLGLAIASLAYLHSIQRLSFRWALLLLIPLVTALSMTAARAGWLYLVAMMVLAWASNRYRPGDTASRLWKFTWFLIPTYLLAQLLLPLLPLEGLIMPGEAVISKAAADSVRIQWWRQSWEIFLQHPWLGAGFGQFSWHQFLMSWPDTPAGYKGWVEHSHNIITQLLAETGLVGTAIFLSGGVAWIGFGRREPLSAERWWILALLSVMGIHALLEYPVWFSFFLGPIALLLGLGEEKTLPSSLKAGRWLLGLLLILGSALLVITMKQNAVIEGWLLRGFKNDIRLSESQYFYRAMLDLSRGTLNSPTALLTLEQTLQADRQNLAQKLKINEVVMRYRPNPESAYKRATLLALNNQIEEAQLQLHRALIAFPPSNKRRNQFVFGLMSLANRGEGGVVPLLLQLTVTAPTDKSPESSGARSGVSTSVSP